MASDKMTNTEMMKLLLGKLEQLSTEVATLKAERASGPIESKPKGKKGDPRPDIHYVIAGRPTADAQIPPQYRRVINCLAQAAPEGGRMTEVEVWNALMGEASKLGAWSYRQDAFYIFKYYRAKMIESGYVKGPFDQE